MPECHQVFDWLQDLHLPVEIFMSHEETPRCVDFMDAIVLSAAKTRGRMMPRLELGER